MDEVTKNTIVENDREWRKYMINSLELIRAESARNAKEISTLKTWNKVWRFAGTTFVGIIIYYIKDRIFNK